MSNATYFAIGGFELGDSFVDDAGCEFGGVASLGVEAEGLAGD